MEWNDTVNKQLKLEIQNNKWWVITINLNVFSCHTRTLFSCFIFLLILSQTHSSSSPTFLFVSASIGRLWWSSRMSFRCRKMVPGWDRKLGRGLRSEEQAWCVHTGHQTARLDPWNHICIVDSATAAKAREQKRYNNVNIMYPSLPCTKKDWIQLWSIFGQIVQSAQDTNWLKRLGGCMHRLVRSKWFWL